MMDAHILWLRDEETISTAELINGLGLPEREECAGLHDPARQRSFSLSRYLLRHALTSCAHVEEADIRLTRARSGRLQLASPDGWHISLSHASGLAAVIVAAAPCGVDIERPRLVDVKRIAERYFSAQEQSWLQQHPDTRQADFFRLWTLKEAGVKALGAGLANHLDRLAFDLSGGTPEQCGDLERMALWQQSGPDLVLAAAVKTEEPVNWQATFLQIDGLRAKP